MHLLTLLQLNVHMFTPMEKTAHLIKERLHNNDHMVEVLIRS